MDEDVPPPPPPLVFLPPSLHSSGRHLSATFLHPLPDISSPNKLAWVSLQGRLVNSEEASSVRTIGGALIPQEAIAWELFNLIHRFLIVVVISVAATESKKSQQIWQLKKSIKLRVRYFFCFGEVVGSDWAEYKPERWLGREGSGEDSEKWRYVARDPFSYPVFQAGPKIYSGKEIAYLQMKRVVGAILTRFMVVSAMPKGMEPQFVSFLNSKMKGSFPVMIHSLN